MQKGNVNKKELSSRSISLPPSFRRVSVRNRGERNRLTAAPIFRTPTFRNDEARGNGFALIELLVVVLIIGILAAVALPQYQKAVEKARASEALPLLKSVYQAAQNYQLANGEWPTKFDELAVEIPWTGTIKWRDSGVMKDTRSNNLWSLQLYWESEGSTAIDIGRISGSYKGVGFHVNPSGALACVEKTGEGVIFDGNEGDYCVKIMRCSDTHNTYDNGRYYRSCPFRF